MHNYSSNLDPSHNEDFDKLFYLIENLNGNLNYLHYSQKVTTNYFLKS